MIEDIKYKLNLNNSEKPSGRPQASVLIAILNYGKFIGTDQFTTAESDKLIRLPMYYGLGKTEVSYITNTINYI